MWVEQVYGGVIWLFNVKKKKDAEGLRCQWEICCQLSGLNCDVRCAQVDGELQLKKQRINWYFRQNK